MNRRLLFAFLLATLPAHPSLIFQLNPGNGIVSGLPGDTIGWGFTLTPDDSSFYLISSVEFCIGVQTPPCAPTLPGIGTFHDYASFNLLILGPAPIGHPGPYSEDFSPGSPGLGIGDFTIAGTASPQSLTGHINVYFDVYTDDTFSTQLPSGVVSQFAEVEMLSETASVPEPAPLMLMLFGITSMTAGAGARILPRRLTTWHSRQL
jgi:hypothetical protein